MLYNMHFSGNQSLASSYNIEKSAPLPDEPGLVGIQNLKKTQNHPIDQTSDRYENCTNIIVPFVPNMSKIAPCDNDNILHELEGECIALKMELANSNSQNDYLNHELRITKNKNSVLESELKEIKSKYDDMKEELKKLKNRTKELARIKSHLQSNVRESSVERSALMMNLKACQEQRNQYKEQAIAFGNYRVQSQSEKKDLMATIVAMQIELDKKKQEERKQSTKENFVSDESSTHGDISTITSSTVPSKDEYSSALVDEEEDDKQNDRSKSVVSRDLQQWSLKTFGRRISILNDFMESIGDLDFNDELAEFGDTVHERHNNLRKGARERVQEQIERIEENHDEDGSDSSGMSIFRRQHKGPYSRSNSVEEILKSSSRTISSLFRRKSQEVAY